MDVSRAFLRSAPLRRDTYVKLPDVVEKGKADCGLLTPLYGMSTSRKDLRETIRDFLAKEYGCEASSVDKPAVFWPQQGFGYDYGGGLSRPRSNKSG